MLAAADADASRPNRFAVGAVYTQTNDPAGNSVVVFDRFSDGRLSKRESVSTGGNGSFQDVGCGVPGPPADCPILDSQNAVVVAKGRARFQGENAQNDDRRFALVFAVNAGSNTITSFREEEGSGLRKIHQVSSGGVMPESLALHGDLLYVLNVATENSNGTTGNIYGLRFDDYGRMTPVGSSQPLANAAPPDHSADPRAIEFKPNGKVIAVTEIAAGFMGPGPPGRIDTFVVGPDGKAGPAVSYPSSAPLPFGFAFDGNDHMIVSNITSLEPGAIGTVSSYHVSDTGVVTPIQTVSSGGTLPCWVVISGDNGFAYVVNTGAGNGPALVTHFGLSPAGTLTPLAPPAEHSGDFARTDAAMSRDSKFLYVLAPSVGPGPPSHIDAYRRNQDGSLTFLGSTPAGANLGVGATGLAAH